MPIERVSAPKDRQSSDPLFKLVVPIDGLSDEFRERVQQLLEDAPQELATSFDQALRRVQSEA